MNAHCYADMIRKSAIEDRIVEIRTACYRLLEWQRGGKTNFTSLLFDLIAKADHMNRAILLDAYPVETSTYIAWRESKSTADFCKANGIEMPGGLA